MESDWIIDAPFVSLVPGTRRAGARRDPEARTVSLTDFIASFQRMRDETQDAAGIWRLGADYDLATLGPTGVAIGTAPRLGDALRALSAGFPLIQSGTEVSFEVTGDSAEFRYRVLDPRVWPRQGDAELTMGLVFGLVTRFVPGAAQLVEVAFEHGSDAASRSLEAALMRPPAMSAELNSVALPVSALDLRAPAGEWAASAHSRACARIRREVRRATETMPIDARVREEVLKALGSERFDQSRVARALGCSDRTLRVRLRAAGTSYRRILEECRAEMAEGLLTRTTLSVAEISDRLGYAEQSAFSRAAHRWFGCSPDRRRGS